MIEKLAKYITPLRVFGIWMLVWAVADYINTEKIIAKGHEPGLGGLGYLLLGFVSILAFSFDLILSLTLVQKKNWIVQLVLALIFLVWVWLS